MDLEHWALKTAKTEYTHYHLNSDNIYTQLALLILKIRNDLQIPNEITKNEGEKNEANTQAKQKKHSTILKFEHCELIPYIADLTELFIFSGVNNKRKSRH